MSEQITIKSRRIEIAWILLLWVFAIWVRVSYLPYMQVTSDTLSPFVAGVRWWTTGWFQARVITVTMGVTEFESIVLVEVCGIDDHHSNRHVVDREFG